MSMVGTVLLRSCAALARAWRRASDFHRRSWKLAPRLVRLQPVVEAKVVWLSRY